LDFVVGVTVVLADGSIVEASESENSDLFWGIKGAGSNFGIVASWRLSTFEAPTVLTKLAVSLGWNRSTAVTGLHAVEQYVRFDMPQELNFRIADYSSGNAGLEGLFYGPPDAARAAIAPLLATAAPNAVITEARQLNWIQSVIGYSNYEDIDFITPSPQENFYAKSLVLKTLSGEAAENFINYWLDEASQVTERFWFFQLDIHGGAHSAISQVPQDATSYAHRDKLFLIQFYDRLDNNSADWQEPEWFGFLDGWVDAVTESLPGSDWGAYANYVDANFDREEAQRLYYGSHLRRLQRLKSRYDPDELFYYPQSIEPVY
jgi:FAD/FMN-containing dehydrogenase